MEIIKRFGPNGMLKKSTYLNVAKRKRMLSHFLHLLIPFRGHRDWNASQHALDDRKRNSYQYQYMHCTYSTIYSSRQALTVQSLHIHTERELHDTIILTMRNEDYQNLWLSNSDFIFPAVCVSTIITALLNNS